MCGGRVRSELGARSTFEFRFDFILLQHFFSSSFAFSFRVSLAYSLFMAGMLSIVIALCCVRYCDKNVVFGLLARLCCEYRFYTIFSAQSHNIWSGAGISQLGQFRLRHREMLWPGAFIV